MMISNILVLFLGMILAPGITIAFRPPENPIGFSELKTPLVLKKNLKTATTTEDSINVITPKMMERVGKIFAEENTARSKSIRKRWNNRMGKVASDYEDEYWHNPSIHSFGNIGILGAVHAMLAPISTKIIDAIAYDGKDVRSIIARKLSRIVMARNRKAGSNLKVLDMCCGVGMSTCALQDAFPDSESVIGVDTSSEMINFAAFYTNCASFIKSLESFLTNVSKKERREIFTTKRSKKLPRRAKYIIGNAERTQLPSKSFDLVTVMYAFHEAPMIGRERIIREAHRILQPGGTLAVIDISTEYEPSASMLSGEPYVLEYQKNIHRQMRSVRGFSNVRYTIVVPDHVGMWTLKRSK